MRLLSWNDIRHPHIRQLNEVVQLLVTILRKVSKMVNQSLKNLNESEKLLILNVLKKIAPLECDIVGTTTLERIIAGYEFKEFSGGHHMDISETIGLLGGIASIIQITIIAGQWGRKKVKDKTREKIKERTITEVNIEITNNINLYNITLKNENLLKNIYDVVDKELNSDESTKF